MKDALGNRMKNQYENRTRFSLPRRTYTIIRIDGKAFHTYTRGFDSPFDSDFMCAMDRTAEALCREIDGCQFAFIQSDEISLLLSDFKHPTTAAWFDGNIQKIASVSASIAAAEFNIYMYYMSGKPKGRKAYFDARVFTIPDEVEVENYFIWRQKDWIRNSINAVAQSHYSSRELHGKNQTDLLQMISQKKDHWYNYSVGEKRGRVVRKTDVTADGTVKKEWKVDNEIPNFVQERDYLMSLIPLRWEEDRV